MVDIRDLYKIGIGTRKINYQDIDSDMPGLMHSYYSGQNYLSLYMLYDNGQVVRSMKSFVDKVDRDKMFINTNLEPMIEKVEDVERQLDEYLEILGLDYVDSLQIHSYAFAKMPLGEIYKEIKRLVDIGKVRYIGVSNTNLEQLKEIEEVVKVDFFEGVYNLECKIYEDNGMLQHCLDNDIIFMCYQPLRRNRTAMRNYEVLVKLAEKYGKTQNQILLNWITKEKSIFPLIKSTNIERIDENLAAFDFEMSKEDYQKLNEFRCKQFDDVEIDWYCCNGGVTIDQLANQFD